MSTSASTHYLLFAELDYAFEILRPLQDAARRRGAEVVWFLHGPSTQHLRAGERSLHSVNEVMAFDPDAVFVPGNAVPPWFPGLKVQVFHGLGIEKKGHFRIRGMFDLFCTFGPLTTQPFDALAKRHGWFKVVETGWPKLDGLLGDAAEREIEKRILYAPTFSPALTSTPALADVIADIVARRDWKWTVKFHPKMDAQLAAPIRRIQGENFDLAASTELLPLLHDADVLLTDTSSTAAEFMLLDKPVIAFRNRVPGPHLLNIDHADELEPALDAVFGGEDSSREARRQYARDMHPWRDGCSSGRVLDAVEGMLAQGRSGLQRKPWSPLRRLKYWRALR